MLEEKITLEYSQFLAVEYVVTLREKRLARPCARWFKFQNWRINDNRRHARVQNAFFKCRIRFIVILNRMSLACKIVFVLITVIWIRSTDIDGQEIDSPLGCNGTKNCETCVQDSSCFWCETQLSCQVYETKNKDERTKACGEWRWKSCEKADASVPLIAIISGCASVALIFGKCSISPFFLKI